MAQVTETQLPGVGVRYEFRAANGDLIGVVHHHGGRREVVVYDRDDPDVGRATMDLTAEDSRTLTDVLGATQVSEALGAVRQQIEGLALDWVDVAETSPLAGRTIGEGELRSRTGASVVAVIRGSTTEPAPGPEFVLEPGDIAVAVGTPEGLEQLGRALRG